MTIWALLCVCVPVFSYNIGPFSLAGEVTHSLIDPGCGSFCRDPSERFQGLAERGPEDLSPSAALWRPIWWGGGDSPEPSGLRLTLPSGVWASMGVEEGADYEGLVRYHRISPELLSWFYRKELVNWLGDSVTDKIPDSNKSDKGGLIISVFWLVRQHCNQTHRGKVN